jgi:hypothetical protein
MKSGLNRLKVSRHSPLDAPATTEELADRLLGIEPGALLAYIADALDDYRTNHDAVLLDKLIAELDELSRFMTTLTIAEGMVPRAQQHDRALVRERLVYLLGKQLVHRYPAI